MRAVYALLISHSQEVVSVFKIDSYAQSPDAIWSRPLGIDLAHSQVSEKVM